MKNHDKELTDFLERLYNRVLRDRVVPLSWRTDPKIPIPKGGDPLDPGNSRLIAIHSVTRKIFTKIMDRRIRSFADIDDVQNGFRKDRRCCDHAAIMQDLIRNAKNKKRELYIAVFHFQKAFDNVDA